MIRRIAILLLLLLPPICATGAGRPDAPFESFTVKTTNIPQADIAGWFLPATSAKGTVILLHGYNNNKAYMVDWANWIRRDEKWNCVLIDFREHGQSTRTKHLCSLGYHEIWDVKAAVDYAESKGLARPYVIFGRSLGAAVGLRWAAMDERISGVFAVSPYKNAYLASEQITQTKLKISFLPSPFLAHPGFKAMLKEVDIVAAAQKRDDLRLWIMTGEWDCFTPGDQREILKASPAPASLKRLEIARGRHHGDVCFSKGDALTPSHDQYLRQFLAASSGQPYLDRVHVAAMLGGGLVTFVTAWFVTRRIAGRAITGPGGPSEPRVP
jgi:pimeloyl-ACP methyl ester carboxylesterase